VWGRFGIAHFVKDGPGRFILNMTEVVLWDGVGGERVGHTGKKDGVIIPMCTRYGDEAV
jgi:hypothetical protein